MQWVLCRNLSWGRMRYWLRSSQLCYPAQTPNNTGLCLNPARIFGFEWLRILVVQSLTRQPLHYDNIVKLCREYPSKHGNKLKKNPTFNPILWFTTFVLFAVRVYRSEDPELTLNTCVQWEHTLDWALVHHRSPHTQIYTLIHAWGDFE